MAQPTGSQHTDPKSDIDIARAATKRPILDLAQDRLGIAAEHLVPFGHDKAKITLDHIGSLQDRPDGKLILVTAITPTPAGEGKTTTTVGLGDGLNRIGKKAVIEFAGAQPGDVLDTLSDSSRLQEEYGFVPKVSLEEGIMGFIEWYRSYYIET